MEWGLGVRITNRLDGTTQDRVFGQFPVRVGRNSLNDLTLEEAFVSQFHLLIVLREEKLWLIDLGSTNGTQLPNLGRAPTNQPIELAKCGFAFSIVALDFAVYSAPLERAQPSNPSQRRRLPITGMLSLAQLAAPAADTTGVINEMHAPYAAYRAAWAELARAIDSGLGSLPQALRPAVVERLSSELDAINREPEFGSLCARHGVEAPSGDSYGGGPAQPHLESVALAGIRDLASDFCGPSGALESVDSLIGFIERIQHVMDVFFRGFISLRDGQRQFETDMAVRRTGEVSSSVTLSAKNANELAQSLLDWRHPRAEEIAEVERSLADFMIHQVALLNGVMSGVRTLLVEFSPNQLERKAQDERFNPEGIGIGPYRYKSLWKTLERVHGDFTGEDRQIFSVLFGPQFAKAYETQFKTGASPSAPAARGHVRTVGPGAGMGGGRDR